MINKKILIGLSIFGFLSACTSPTVMIGPAFTFSSTGSIAQTGLTYGSNELVTNYTGKTTIENLETITSNNLSFKKNIHKKTLESEDFYHLVKNRIEKTRNIIKSPSQ